MRYEFTRIQELSPLCFSFSGGTTRAPATDELRLDAHKITGKKHYLARDFQLILNIRYLSLS